MTLVLGLVLPATAQTSYRVGPGDLLKISVIELEEMENEYRVDNLGFLNMPYLGRVDVKNATILELQEKITDELKAYVNDPQVLIDILEYNFRPISVIGAVKTPGKLKRLTRSLNLIDAISESGGRSDNAGDKIFVIRKTPENMSETLQISYRELMIEGDGSLNIPLFPGDTINIPVEQPLLISVIGEVNTPGEHEFSRSSKVTILRVIAAAGGFTTYANRRKVLVQRDVNGKKEQIEVNVRKVERNREVDIEMKDNDVVIVQ
jgi:polysaccharide export outer membrane protein